MSGSSPMGGQSGREIRPGQTTASTNTNSNASLPIFPSVDPDLDPDLYKAMVMT